VQASIDDKPDGTPGSTAKHAEPLRVVGVQAELVGQPLCVKAPPLAMRHDVECRLQQGQMRLELHAGELHMVSGHPFVKCHGFQRPGPSVSGLHSVEQVRAGTRAVLSRWRIVGRRAELGHMRRHGLDPARRRQRRAEHIG